MDQASHNLSPCKASRIQSLKIRFSDTILKANKIIKGPPESPPSRKLMQRTKERESARRTILNMEKISNNLRCCVAVAVKILFYRSNLDFHLRNWVYTSRKMMSCKVRMRRLFLKEIGRKVRSAGRKEIHS
ncbi:hypothetical protein GBA52_016370 [Prunus armeniaca]|nr:hypothetical protein GBA52_016370 [Prunus armeniaca]